VVFLLELKCKMFQKLISNPLVEENTFGETPILKEDVP